MTKKHKQGALPGASEEAGEATNDDTPPDAPDVPFEDAIEELEAIVHELEEGELALEDAMARFERGLLLVKTCSAKLKQAELRVSELLEDGETAALEE